MRSGLKCLLIMNESLLWVNQSSNYYITYIRLLDISIEKNPSHCKTGWKGKPECFGSGVGLDDPQRSLATPNIL